MTIAFKKKFNKSSNKKIMNLDLADRLRKRFEEGNPVKIEFELKNLKIK